MAQRKPSGLGQAKRKHAARAGKAVASASKASASASKAVASASKPTASASKASASASKPSGKSGAQLGEDVARGMIMAGGARVFAMKGIRETSVEDVLEAANVSRRTFYRLYDSKEDVALALYIFGTNQLIERWKRAIEISSGTLDAFTKCIDVFITHAAMLGRLIFVLGGEASRQESPLHKHRMFVHDALVEMLRTANPEIATVDPLVLRATLFALEATTRHILTEGDEGRRVNMAVIERARNVMNRIVTAGFAGDGPGVTPMPRLPAT